MRKQLSISDLVLLVLEQAVDGFVELGDFARYHSATRYEHYKIKKSALSKALTRLRKQGYIDSDTYEDELIIKLTDTGKAEAILRKILTDEDWDGKWRVVVFDIPEKQRKARNILRGRLKMWGFTQWQKSVWASKKNITNPLRKFIKDIGVEKWVLVLESENVGIGQTIDDRQ